MTSRQSNPTISLSSSQISNDLITRRQQALNILDEAKLSLFHIRICLVASVGFFTDGYSLHALSFMFLMFGPVYGADTLADSARFMMKTSIRFGSILGHLLFGYMADKYGRKKVRVNYG